MQHKKLQQLWCKSPCFDHILVLFPHHSGPLVLCPSSHSHHFFLNPRCPRFPSPSTWVLACRTPCLPPPWPPEGQGGGRGGGGGGRAAPPCSSPGSSPSPAGWRSGAAAPCSPGSRTAPPPSCSSPPPPPPPPPCSSSAWPSPRVWSRAARSGGAGWAAAPPGSWRRTCPWRWPPGSSTS